MQKSLLVSSNLAWILGKRDRNGWIWCYNLRRFSCLGKYVVYCEARVDVSHSRIGKWWDLVLKLQVLRTIKKLVRHLARLQRDYQKRELKDAQQMVVCSNVCERQNKCHIIKQAIPIRTLFMSHLHVTHITEGLQIVKYRTPFICHKCNKNKATVTYTKHIHLYTRYVHLSV
jgi:hypothetical protein